MYKRIPNDIHAPQPKNLFDVYEKYIGYKENGFFVEVGAFDGYCWSNTLTLIEAGWRGIMVEADPANYAALLTHHGANKKLQLIGCAIGRTEGMAKLYRGGSTSTIFKDTLSHYHNYPPLASTGLSEENYLDAPVWTMDVLLSTCNCPQRYDVFVLDIEGGEIDALASYDIERWRPTLAIVETHETLTVNPTLSAKAVPIGQFFAEHDYVKVSADTINTIYVDRTCYEAAE